MKWLPSFVKLFLLFIAGLALLMGSVIGESFTAYSYTTSSIFAMLRLFGMLLMLVSPLLIALKYFAQLDQKSKQL
jgi:uncharacterized membrane protein